MLNTMAVLKFLTNHRFCYSLPPKVTLWGCST